VRFSRSIDLTSYMPPLLKSPNPDFNPHADGNSGAMIPAIQIPKNEAETTPPFLYSLYGVTNHYGSLTSGHYTSFVRSPNNASVWHKFDDTKATKMAGEDVVTRNAYILFWVRGGVM